MVLYVPINYIRDSGFAVFKVVIQLYIIRVYEIKKKLIYLFIDIMIVLQ